ncbi:MAG: hypothetical protein V4792_18495 [Pseudomonadota bacterium]
MNILLRGLAFTFLVLGFACAVNAVNDGTHVLEAGVCFLLEVMFVRLYRNEGAAIQNSACAWQRAGAFSLPDTPHKND